MTRRPTRPCPAFGVACELAVMADVSVAQAAEIERLRAALERFACTCDRVGNAECSSGEVDCPFWQARAALEEGRT